MIDCRGLSVWWSASVTARTVGILVVDVVVIHRLPHAIPFYFANVPVTFIEIVVGQWLAVVAERSVDTKAVHGVSIQGGVRGRASLVG